MKFSLTILAVLLCAPVLKSQEVKWLSFEQLDSAMNENPKPVFIEFYTDWCVYCKKMEEESFTDSDIVELLNSDYYSVRFNAESKQAVTFDGLSFIPTNEQRFHPIVNLLATRKGATFTPPVLIFMNSKMNVEARSFEYLSRAELKKSLHSFSKK